MGQHAPGFESRHACTERRRLGAEGLRLGDCLLVRGLERANRDAKSVRHSAEGGCLGGRRPRGGCRGGCRHSCAQRGRRRRRRRRSRRGGRRLVNAGWIRNLSPPGGFGSFGNFGSSFFVELHPRQCISIGFVTRFEPERDFKRTCRVFVTSQRQVRLTHASSGVMSGTVVRLVSVAHQ